MKSLNLKKRRKKRLSVQNLE